MRTILFAWELGTNLGHAYPMAAIARGLAGEDVGITVVTRDLVNARLAFADIPARFLPAPVWPPHRQFGAEDGQMSYLDLLAWCGFLDPNKLAAIMAGWDGILDLVRPDVVVADHSPGLMATASSRQLPVIAVGTAFTLPPLDFDRFPPLRGDRSPLVPEDQAFRAVTEAFKALKATPPRSLLGIFRTGDRIVIGIPELDPYRAFRREALHLPPEPLPSFSEVPIEPSLFVYLGDDTPNLNVIVQALTGLRVPVKAYLRGEVGYLPQFLRLSGHQVFDRPPSLAEVLPTVSHVLSAGGAFTSQAALAAGRPHLVIPLQGETNITANFLLQMNVGRRFEPTADAAATAGAIEDFIGNHTISREARHWAQIIAARPQPSSSEAVRAAIRRSLRPERVSIAGAL